MSIRPGNASAETPREEAVATRARASALRFFREPVDDYIAAIDGIRDRGIAGLACVIIALIAAWFLYVPIHELLHAWGCLAAGGTVTRLDIAPEYGGAWLATIFPYVRSGSEYAGQLTGFDTHGNDAIYVATVLAPYLLTIFIGVPLIQWVGRPRLAVRSHAALPWVLGIAAVFAYAPAISLIGDYYEAGSIIVTRLTHVLDPSFVVARWRSDDLPKLLQTLRTSDAQAVDWIGVANGFLVGALLALLTWRIGSGVSRLIMSRSPPRG